MRQIEIFDTGIAILAGFMIIPAAFSVTGSADAVAAKAGPGLMFGVLPGVFQDLGVTGNFLGFVFFALVFFAAITSAISLFETCVSIVCDGFHKTRKTSLIICSVITIAVAIFVNMGYNNLLWMDPMYSIFGIGTYQSMQILDFFDFVSNTVMMPIVALLTCIFVGYIIKPKVLIDEIKQSSPFVAEKLFTVMIKFIAPVFVVLILVFYILNTIGVVSL